MKSIVPMELRTAFDDPRFQELLKAKTEKFGLDKRPFFQMYNEEEILNLVKSYIVYAYNNITDEAEKQNYPSTLKDELAVSFICSTFLGICQEAFKEDQDIRKEALEDFNNLNELRSYREKEEFKNLDFLNLPICEVIENSDWLDDYDFTKLNVNEIVQLTKCVILKQCSTLSDLYDKINSIIREKHCVAVFVRFATEAYIKGTKTEGERKEAREKFYNLFVSINIINMGMGYTRKNEE